jgi:hypothetical protein
VENDGNVNYVGANVCTKREERWMDSRCVCGGNGLDYSGLESIRYDRPVRMYPSRCDHELSNGK